MPAHASCMSSGCASGDAIGNAVADALGVEGVEVPLTPSRVWELLER